MRPSWSSSPRSTWSSIAVPCPTRGDAPNARTESYRELDRERVLVLLHESGRGNASNVSSKPRFSKEPITRVWVCPLLAVTAQGDSSPYRLHHAERPRPR